MLYVLKFVGAGPDHFLENFYDEVVVVKDKIALVKFEHNKECLLGMNFEEVGTIEKEEDLKQLFKEQNVAVEVRKEPGIQRTVPLDSILPGVEGAQKSWYENLE